MCFLVDVWIWYIDDICKYELNNITLQIIFALQFYELDVYVLPSIDGSDEVDRSKVILGNDFTLECPVTGIPFPTIRWFKGTVYLKSFLGDKNNRIVLHTCYL